MKLLNDKEIIENEVPISINNLPETEINSSQNELGDKMKMSKPELGLKCAEHNRAITPKSIRFFILISTLFETIIFSGLIFGWPALFYMLKNEQIFFHLCSANDAIKFGNNATNNNQLFDVISPNINDNGINGLNVINSTMSPLTTDNQTAKVSFFN